MPYELSDLIAKRVRTVAIDATAEGETQLLVRYSPDAMTPEVWARLQGWVKDKSNENADPFDAAKYILEPLIRGFSVSERGVVEPLTVNGAPFPVEAAAIAGMGLDFVSAISGALMTDFNTLRDTSGPKGRSSGPSAVPTTPPPDSLIGTSP